MPGHERPIRVLLMPEYGVDLPLWDRSPGPGGFGDLSREDLGLSAELAYRLEDWNARWESWAMASLDVADDEDPNDEDKRIGHAFALEAHLLAADLQEELGADVLVLYPEADSEKSRGPRAAPDPGGNWQVVHGITGTVFTPEPEPVSAPGPEDELRAMPDDQFLGVLERVDVDALAWSPTVKPWRMLLGSRSNGLPLRDVTPRAGVPEEPLAADTLGLSSDLTRRLSEWNQMAERTGMTVPLMVAGHRLAADLSRELGPGAGILFPEADAEWSTPTAEAVLLVDRARAVRAGLPWEPPEPAPVPDRPDKQDTGMIWSAFPPDQSGARP